MFIRQSFCLFSYQGILQMAVVCCYVGCLHVCVVCFKPRVTFLPIQLSPWRWSAKTSRWAEQHTGSLDEKSEIRFSVGANRVTQKEETFSSWGWGWEDKAPISAHTQTRFSERQNPAVLAVESVGPVLSQCPSALALVLPTPSSWHSWKMCLAGSSKVHTI